MNTEDSIDGIALEEVPAAPDFQAQAPNRYERTAGGATLTVDHNGTWTLVEQGQAASSGDLADVAGLLAKLADLSSTDLSADLSTDAYWHQLVGMAAFGAF